MLWKQRKKFESLNHQFLLTTTFPDIPTAISISFSDFGKPESCAPLASTQNKSHRLKQILPIFISTFT